MKKKETGILPEDAEKDFTDGINLIEKSINAAELIAPKDKDGAKLTNKEAIGFVLAFENIDKFEHKLPRDFDEKGVKTELDGLQAKSKKVDRLDRAKKQIEAQTTTARVNLKPKLAIMYKAAQEAAKEDASLVFVVDKMKEAYAREVAKIDDAPDKGEDPKAKKA